MTRNNSMLATVPVGFFGFDPFETIDRMMVPAPKPHWVQMGNVKCDVKETENGFEITADLPGAAKEDIDLSIDGTILTLSYEKNEEKEEGGEEAGYIVKERSTMSVKRSFDLGEIDETTAKANLDAGVLTITVDKREPVETKTSIEIS